MLRLTIVICLYIIGTSEILDFITDPKKADLTIAALCFSVAYLYLKNKNL